jgi:thiamine-monophosphate kinase
MPLSEDDLIARFFAPIAGPAGFGLKDDVARLTPPPGRDLVVTVDGLVAGVHFFPDDPPELIAAKALRVNLSDLASKGAAPLGFLLTLALPKGLGDDWLEAFAQGLGEDAKRFDCPLMGGDTVHTPGPLTLSITALGAVAPGAMPMRTGARPGDVIFVSGTIGDAALGLKLRLGQGPKLDEAHRDYLIGRYLKPEPRLGLAAALKHAHAAMDVSDGLVGDLAKMLRASGVSGELDLREVPFSPAALAYAGGIEIAVTGGDDYEVLAAVPEAEAASFVAAAAPIPIRAVGRVTEGADGLRVIGLDGQPARFARGSYSHF